jgi:hypothetical protein
MSESLQSPDDLGEFPALPTIPVIDHSPVTELPVIEFRPYDIQTFFANMPGEVKDLHIREAYMAKAAQMIGERQKENRALLAQAEAARPSLLLAWRKEVMARYKAGVAAAASEVDEFAKALAQNERAMENLRHAARRELELWLRNHDTTYQQGLANEQFVADWRNAVALVRKILLDFIQSVGEARNIMVSGYKRETNEHSPQAAELLLRAVRIGNALEEDMASVNLLAEEHDKRFRGTVFENPFPRLPVFAAGELTGNAIKRPIALLQQHFDRIKRYCEELSLVGIAALSAAIDQAEKRHTAQQDSYMTTLWAGLSVLAQQQVAPDLLSDKVRETEERFLRGEYA